MTSLFLSDFFLSFTHFVVVVPFMLVGYFFINKKLFIQTTCLVAISMIVNVALKATFHIPLSPSLHKVGFAFPSGHTQFATVLYGWLAFNSRALTWRLCAIILILGVGYGLYVHHYHDVADIAGGLVTGGILIVLYHSLLTITPQRSAFILCATATLLMIYNALIYTLVPIHAWWAYLSLWLGSTLDILNHVPCKQKKII